MSSMVRVEDALKHIEGVEIPEDPPKQEFEGRERLRGRPHELANQDENVEEWDKHETSAGDPRFLSIILDCHDRRAKLFGLYPKIDKEGLSLDDDDIVNVTPQERANRLRNYLDKARQNRSHQLALKSANAQTTAEQLNRAPLNRTHKENEQSIFEKRAIEVTARTLPTPQPSEASDYGDF
jgi:hypothetical protein